jgi:hypothetical protein
VQRRRQMYVRTKIVAGITVLSSDDMKERT